MNARQQILVIAAASASILKDLMNVGARQPTIVHRHAGPKQLERRAVAAHGIQTCAKHVHARYGIFSSHEILTFVHQCDMFEILL